MLTKSHSPGCFKLCVRLIVEKRQVFHSEVEQGPARGREFAGHLCLGSLVSSTCSLRSVFSGDEKPYPLIPLTRAGRQLPYTSLLQPPLAPSLFRGLPGAEAPRASIQPRLKQTPIVLPFNKTFAN